MMRLATAALAALLLLPGAATAQQARGADFDSGNLFRRAKALVPILVPLFISAFRIAQDLAMAMEARCYHGGDNRTRLKVFKLKGIDYLAMLIIAAEMAFIISGQKV